MSCFENGCEYERGGNGYNRCRCCECCPYPKPEPPKPEPHKKEAAQFVNDGVQKIDNPATTAIEFNTVAIADAKSIDLQGLTSILLAAGRYIVSYYLTVENRDNDSDTLEARLKVGNVILDYTVGRLLIDNENDDDENKPLSKTNLIDVTHPLVLQLVVSSPDRKVDFRITDASIVIEKIS